jgi:5-methylcytosine-specific restriction endonuclease McrA
MILSRRKKPRPGRIDGKRLAALRLICFARYRGLCMVCGKKLYLNARFDGDPDAYDMAHKRNKRMWGDNLDNVQAECHACHMTGHSGNKPCPPKPTLTNY